MSRRSGEVFDPDPLPQVPSCSEKPFDLLAEIERELPFVLYRHEPPTRQNSNSEKFRDTDSIRFLKQNRLSWWNSPASKSDMDELEPPQNIYEVVEEESKHHEYECIPEDFFLKKREMREQQQQPQKPQQQQKDTNELVSSGPINLSTGLNPFLNSNYDVPMSPEVDVFSQCQPLLYDHPRSPSSGIGETSSACPTSISTSTSDPLDVSISVDNQSSTYDIPHSPAFGSPSPDHLQDHYNVPAEHFTTTPRKPSPDREEIVADVCKTFPRTRRDFYEAVQEAEMMPPLPSTPPPSYLMGYSTDTYDIPIKSESVSDRSDFASLLSESAYDVPSTFPPPSSPPPPPPSQEEVQIMQNPPPVPLRPSVIPQQQCERIKSASATPPPVPAPRQKFPPPLPPKQETTPPRSRLPEQRKFSSQPTTSGSPVTKESPLRESGTSLTSWYLDTNQIRNCDIPHRELTASSEDSDPNSVPLMPSMTSTKPITKSQSGSQRANSKRITTAIRTVSNRLMRKPSTPVTTFSESWDSNSADSDTADGVTIFFSSDGRKDYSKRICVISDATLKLYDLNSLSTPSLCLCCDEITIILARRDICPSSKTVPTLFLVDVRSGNSTRLLGFTSAIDRAEFLRRMNHCFNPQSCELQGEIWASGFLKCRFSASGDWQNVKAVLHGKEFTPFPTTNDRDFNVASIDLRKAMVVEWTLSEEASGQDKLFHIVLPCRTIYLRGPSPHETNSWFDLISKTHSTYLDKSLLSEQYLTNDNVPLAIEKCVNFVSAHGTDTTGVYRLAGSHGKIERLVDSLKKNSWGVHLIPEAYSTHDVANALKRFLRSFDDCLLTQRLYDQWMQCSKIESLDERLPRLKDLISELPLVEHSTLRFLCSHLKAIADRSDINCMTIANLAAIFGPTILYKYSAQAYLERDPSLSPTTSMAETNAGMAIAADLLGNFCFLFDVSQAVVEKEREIQKLIAELREARVAQRPAGDILVGVYVYNKEWGRCINVKLTPTMTASELCKFVRVQLKLADPASSLAVFEVICNQQLERPLHYIEPVFPAVLQWTGWDPAFAKDNYLLVKRNFVYEDVINFLNMKEPLANFSEVRFAAAGAKNFRKVSMEFAKSAVQLLKDRREKDKEKLVLKEWRVEDIAVYVGCEANRKAPTKFCLAFVQKNEHVRKSRDRPFLCHTLSLPSQLCHTSWLASVLCARHTNLIPPEEELPDLLTL